MKKSLNLADIYFWSLPFCRCIYFGISCTKILNFSLLRALFALPILGFIFLLLCLILS